MFGNNLADAYKATEAARIKYLQKLSEVAQIEYRLNTPSSIAGHITTAERTALKNSLTQARLEAVALEQTLRGTGKTFVTAASGQVGFDSPEMLRILQGMPDDLVRSSKSIIEGITTSNKSIKQLKVDVKTAQEVLDTAINKGQGGKKITWTRELENFNKAQASLDQALRGNIWEMQQKLIQARSELELARINDDYYHTAATKKTKTDATTKAASAEQTLAQALKTAEVEWGKGGALATNYQDIFKAPAPGGGGSGGSAVPIITTELTPAVSSATFNVPVNIPIAPQVTIPSMTGAVVKTIIPTVVSDAENIPQVTSTTGVESLPTIESVVLVQPTISVAAITDVVSKALPAMLSKLALSTSAISQSQASTIIEAITNTAALAATQALTQGLTTTQIKAAAKVSIASSIKTIPQSEIKTSILPLTDTMVSTAIKAATATQAKVATTIATTVATEVKPLPKPGKFFRLPKIKLPDGTEHQMTEEEFASAVGWKQGIMYIMIFKPYKQNNVTFTRKPIPGIPYKEGARSAYESIRKLKDGKLPAKVKIDLGIMDVIIKTGKKGRGKPKLKFKRDTDQINKGISTAR